MQGKQCSTGEMKRLLNEAQRLEVDRHVTQGLGVALYEDDRGRPILVVPTGGGRGFDIPGPPPAMYGGGTLKLFVPAQPQPRPLGSQYMPPPQIARPRVAPTHTEYPQVQLAMRTSSHPRGKNGFIDAQRLLPGREPEPVLPPEPQLPLSEDQRWWRDHLAAR
jgi:hypothetical protein